MAKPEKRWQLLLVADDGRIIPFKRIKGIAVTLAVLLVLLGLICAGLGWQLTAEKVRHRRTDDQLADAKRQLEHFKSEYELITAELVLAEVRMEKAGLPVTKRRERIPQQPPSKPAEPGATSDATKDGDGQKGPLAVARESTTAKPAPPATTLSPAKPGDETKPAATSGTPPDPAEKAKPPVVALGDLKMTHDTEKKILTARFRVVNNRPRASRVAGQCVVVLKNDGMDPKTWQAMPTMALVDGVPDGKHGRAFRISKFIGMEIMASVESDPSSFTTAVVYVFDTAGTTMLQKAFPIDLPAPKPVATATAAPVMPSAVVPVASAEPDKPAVVLADLKMDHDARTQTLLARFRITNSGPRSSPVAGHCVVVLKNDLMNPQTWLAMPKVGLVNGKPDGNRGQAFKIARYKDMEIKAGGLADPSSFSSAVVYVFDTSGAAILEKEYPIDLPAPEPQPTPEPVPEPVTPPAAQPPPVSVVPQGQSVPADGVPETTGDRQPAQPTDSGSPTPVATDPAVASDDDPSLTDDVAPSTREDHRSRF